MCRKCKKHLFNNIVRTSDFFVIFQNQSAVGNVIQLIKKEKLYNVDLRETNATCTTSTSSGSRNLSEGIR